MAPAASTMMALVAAAALGAVAHAAPLTIYNTHFQHCYLITSADGWDAPYMKAHGYQLQPPQWVPGTCPKVYNWFNRKTTLGDGVTLSTYGIQNKSDTANWVDLVNEDVMVVHHDAYQHCIKVVIDGGDKNPFWGAHGYQMQPPSFLAGGCDRSVYNYFNKKETLAPGVTEYTYGIYTKDAAAQRDDVLVVNNRGNGGKVCTQLVVEGGWSNPEWQTRASQYAPPQWTSGACDKTFSRPSHASELAKGVSASSFVNVDA